MLQYDKAIRAATFVASSQSEDSDFAALYFGADLSRLKANQRRRFRGTTASKTPIPTRKNRSPTSRRNGLRYPKSPSNARKTDVALTLKYRNIKEAAIQVYSVDLMKLYLREKDLRRVTQVRLAGIEPTVNQTVSLGDGKDYIDKEREISLPLTSEGAYLVICRGDNLFTSGLILVTPLEIEIQEDTQSVGGCV